MNKFDKQHLANVKRYQRRIDAIYKKAAEQAAARAASLPVPDDYIFTFDDFPAVKKQIDALLATMAADVEMTVTDGVRAEWDLANAKNDALVDSVFGDMAVLAKYHRTHEDALNAFLQRKQNGLGLSDMVWRYTSQFKDEIEMGLDLGIREGQSAATIARSIQQYLKYPDMLFRRVKDEHGVFQLSQRAAAFHPGQGVYRSSYKNALRLAATETNIAYRSADHERIQDLDFIVGIEIHLSNNHTVLNHKKERVPLFDICDELQGRYPREFKFVGWHPNCRCIATQVFKTKAEMDADDERLKRGEQPLDPHQSENAVTEMPEGFNRWMEDNAERLESAKSMPYFIRDNFKDGDPSQGLRWVVEKPLTPAEIRHMNRTPEDEEFLRDWWNDRKEETRLLKLAADNMLKVAADYGEVDASKLAATLADVHDLNVLQRETKALAQQVLAMKKQEQALADLIPDVHTWHQQFTMAELQATHGAVEGTIDKWLTKYGYKSLDDAPLAHAKAKMDWEISEVASAQKYKTWPVAKAAYEKQLAVIVDKIEIEELKTSSQGFHDYLSTSKTKSKIFKDKLVALDDAIAAKDKAAAKSLIAELDKKQQSLEAYAAKKKSQNIPVSTNNTEQTTHPQRLSGDDERIKQIMQLTGGDMQKAKEYYDAVKGFSFQWDYEIRAYQSGINFTSKHGHTLADIAKKADNLEEFIAKSPKWGMRETYRGMSLSEKDLQQLVDDLKKGIGNMKGSASWSTDKDISMGFAGSHIGQTSKSFGDKLKHRVVLVTRTHEAATSIQPWSRFPGEWEVLASSKCRYRFLGMKTSGNYIYIEVEPAI